MLKSEKGAILGARYIIAVTNRATTHADIIYYQNIYLPTYLFYYIASTYLGNYRAIFDTYVLFFHF